MSTGSEQHPRHRPPPLQLVDGTNNTTAGDKNNSSQQQQQVTVATTSEDVKKYVINIAKRMGLDETAIQRSECLFERVLQCSTLSQLLEANTDRDNYLAACTTFLASRLRYRRNADIGDLGEDITNHIDKFEISLQGTPLNSLLNPEGWSVRLVEFFELLNACTSTFGFEQTPFADLIRRVQKRLIAMESLYQQMMHFLSQLYVKDEKTTDLNRFLWVFYLYLIKLIKTSDFENMYNYFTAWMNYIFEIIDPSWKVYGYASDEIFTQMFIPASDIPTYCHDKIKQIWDELFPGLTLSQILGDREMLSKLELEYEKLLFLNAEESCNDFDGRMFLLPQDLVGPITKMISVPVYQLNPRAEPSFISVDNGMLSPLRSPRSGTRAKNVIQATAIAVQLLKQRLQDELSVPDKELKRFFEGCTIDQTDAIQKRLDSLVELVPFARISNPEDAQFRQELCKKIYYNVLRDMLLGEEKRLASQNFTNLLNNENFHRSHIICSVSTVLFAYNMKDCISFTDLLDSFNLSAFELSIIIESFVQHASWLNSAFRRHFRFIEERLFDSLTWTDQSSLHQKILDSEMDQSLQLPTDAGTMTPLSKKKQRVFSVYQGGQPAQDNKPKGVAVNYFFRKLFRLASQRIQDLCTAFAEHMNRDKVESIWRILYHVLTNHRNLMSNRHLDQIIMCTMYAICKIGKMGISFRDIISNYRFICESARSLSPVEIGKILYRIPFENGESGDIIRFYNNIYIPVLKYFILVNQTSTTPKMPLPYNQPQLTSPHRQKVGNNLWVSPMRGSRRENLPNVPSMTTMELSNQGGVTMTPRTKELYSFGDNFVHRSPSSLVNEHQAGSRSGTGKKKTAKRTLDFGSDSNGKKYSKVGEEGIREGSNDGEDSFSNDENSTGSHQND